MSRSSQGGRGQRGGSWVGPPATAPGGAYPVWGQRENEGLETESQGESRHIVREKGRARNGSKHGGDAVPRPAVSVGGGPSFHAVLAGPKSDPSAAEGEHCYPRGWPG